ncbi:MAG: hypothetical protein HRT67_01325 [Flavobacteriaceae bacterium]|nr:hypothetical protein [Flavobacteriaceae bacterium]
MKKLLILTILCSVFAMHAQDTYTINGSTYELQTEVSGTLTLLWNHIDNDYRYFIKTDNDIHELKNSKDADGNYKMEYKSILKSITENNADAVQFTLDSLKRFISNYNTATDNTEETPIEKQPIYFRLLGFGGITNHPFVDNPENTIFPQFGIEAEVFSVTNMPCHALYLGLSHALKQSDFDYSNTQIYIGYRFRFINSKSFNLYANATVSTFNFTKTSTTYTLEDDTLVTEDISENTFNAPLSFGIGGDIKLTENSYITIMYNELVAIFKDNTGNFPTHIVLGYKFKL